MSSLYNIEQNLLRLFDEIDEQEGEITDEQLEQLTISEDRLKEKLKQYQDAIIKWKADAEACKAEEKRIAQVRRKYDNRCERLKESMKEAVIRFGDDGKSGNKFIELYSSRLYTKDTPSVVVDEVRVQLLINTIMYILNRLNKDGVLDIANFSSEDLLKQVNDRVIELHGKDYVKFTIADLSAIKLQVIVDLPLTNLDKHDDLVYSILNNQSIINIENNTNKDNWKTMINRCKELQDTKVTCADIQKSTSLIIK